MKAGYVLAIDQGTTSTRSCLFDHRGACVAQAGLEISQHYPQSGWVEHDAEEIWQTTLATISEVLRKVGICLDGVEAVGITNQRETTVLWDRATSQPVHPAIVWQCRRTAGRCDQLAAAGRGAGIREKTGLVLDAYFSATKVEWMLDRDPNLRERAQRGELAFGTIDSWLIWKLTGGAHLTDHSNASRTMLYNIHQRVWDDSLLETFNLPREILPEVRSSVADFGRISEALELGGSAPITGVAGDQQAALFGQGACQPGVAKNTYGTGCFLMMCTGAEPVVSKNGLLTTLCCDAAGGPAYALEGAVFIAGAAVQWLRDELGLIDDAADSEVLAAKVADSGGVYVVPAFVGLGAPHWDQDARGAILGLTRSSNRHHIVRATLEAIAFQTRDVCDAMVADTGLELTELRVDGGAAANDLLMQLQADLLRVTVDRPRNTESTAFGAALLAGLGCGFWASSEEIRDIRETDRRFTPKMPLARADEMYAGWQAAVARVRTGGG